MPRGSGQTVEPDIFKILESVEIKKVSEEAHKTIWTPATGKRFLLAGFVVYSAEAEANFFLEDGTTKFFMGVAPKAAASLGAPVVFGPCYQSIAVNNKLQIKVEEVTVKKLIAVFWGTEE